MKELEHRTDDKSAQFLLLVVVVIWATNAPLVKYGLMGLDVFVFNSIRYIVASAVLAGMLLSRQSWIPVERGDWPKFIRLSLIANFIYQLAYIIGIKWTTAGDSAVLLSTSPLWTAFLNARIHKEKIPSQVLLGMGISLTGIVMIVIGSGQKLEFGSNALFGDLLSLGSALLWALNTNMQKPLLNRYSSMQLSVLSIGIGAIGLTLIAVPAAVTLDWRSVRTVHYLIPIISGTLSIAVANVLWSFGVKKIGPRRTGNFTNLVPVIAFVAAYYALNEQVFPIQAIGAAVTVLGVWVARR